MRRALLIAVSMLAAVPLHAGTTNQPPSIVAPSSITRLEDGGRGVRFIEADAVAVVDPEAGVLTIDLEVGAGALYFDYRNFVEFEIGDGVWDGHMRFSGSHEHVRLALSTLDLRVPGDYNGPAPLSIEVTDSAGATVAHTVAIEFTPVVDIADDVFETDQDTDAWIWLNSNDTFEGTPTISNITPPAHGTVTQQVGGRLTYTPEPGYHGPEAFAYTVTSGGREESASVTGTIHYVSAAPQLSPASTSQFYTEDTVTDLIDFVVSDDSPQVSVSLFLDSGRLLHGALGNATWTQDSSHQWGVEGTVEEVNAVLEALQFEPEPDVNEWITLVVSVDDERPREVFEYFLLRGVAVNDAPTSLLPASATVTEDYVYLVAAAGEFAIDDADESPQGGGAYPVVVRVEVDHGLIDFQQWPWALEFIEGGPNLAAMEFTAPTTHIINTLLSLLVLRPEPDFVGRTTLTFSVRDAQTEPLVRTMTVDYAPLADVVDDAIALHRDGAAQFNVLTGAGGASADEFEGPAALQAVSAPSRGTLQWQPDGTITYTPDPGYVGSDSFSYTVRSGDAGETGHVNLAVLPINASPTLDAIGDPSPITTLADPRVLVLTGISAGAGETQALTLTAQSSNPGVIAGPVIDYTSPEPTALLGYSPIVGQPGSAMITVTVRDDGGTSGGGVDAVSRSFEIIVTPPADRVFASGFELP